MKKRVGIDLDAKVVNALEKRAQRELLSLKELIEDIIRRSVLSSKGKQAISGKGDDKFIEYFSRIGYKHKKKGKKKK